MELWIGALNLGLLYAIMTMGVFITFRIYDFPDITVDGSFTTGAAVTAILIVAGVNPILAVGFAFFAGALAGMITALIHTRFKVNGLLAGILVMTGLYSINLHIMGRSNTPLLKQTTIFTFLDSINPGLHPEIWTAIVITSAIIFFWILISLFFITDFGIAMRITGNNPTMASTNGINVDWMKVIGIALSNGLVGVAGGMVAQYQGFADIGMGIGTIVIGLAAVIIGQSMIRGRSMFLLTLSVILGSIVFRFMIAFALQVGMNPIDLKLLTAVFVLLTLIGSKTVTGRRRASTAGAESSQPFWKKTWTWAGCAVLALVGFLGYTWFFSDNSEIRQGVRIGVLQITDHALLNITRDSFVEEMARIGYVDGENCSIRLENANGDMPTVSTILDDFRRSGVDIYIPISTPCTQATINKIKDRPVVFATVANPFIIDAGKSDSDHLPNVTGVYGWAPMKRTIAMARDIIPGLCKIGSIWDPAHANSVWNVDNLKQSMENFPGMEFYGETITHSSEVFQAAQSLVHDDIEAFILSPDNIVYSAFEAVVKAAKPAGIPIFISDVERINDGALAAIGYDYTNSGIQAAHLVDQILNGADPGTLPFQRYRKLTEGYNLDVADELGLTIPDNLLSSATLMVRDGKLVTLKKSSEQEAESGEKRLALFLFGDYQTIMVVSSAVQSELESSGVLSQHNITIQNYNAQNDFVMAQTIAQDIVHKEFDFIVTLSTPALQVTANTNDSIPHVFGFVTDPYRMGVADDPEHHLPHVTGVATLQPVETTIQIMRRIFPEADSIGMVWNPAEACSEACTEKARSEASRLNFKLEEVSVSTTSDVIDAVNTMISRDVDLFLTSGDNTVGQAVESIALLLKRAKIPYFTNMPNDVEIGTLLSIGADYYEVGRETGRMAIRVINGGDPSEIPIRNYAPEKMYINAALAQEFGIQIPEAIMKQASKVWR